MRDHPGKIVEIGRVEPVPRRVRAVLASRTVLDTTRALYVWEWPYYPQFYVPLADVDPAVLVDGRHHVHRDDAVPQLRDTVRLEWSALDAWYEEDEQIFVHPRDPYTRVDAVRSSRTVRVELDGVVLAESSSPVMVFETGLPTRYYLPRTDVRFEALVPSDTVSQCPYKGITSAYWSVPGAPGAADIAWAYDFPTAALLPIAGMVAFYNEKVDVVLDSVLLARPTSIFSAA